MKKFKTRLFTVTSLVLIMVMTVFAVTGCGKNVISFPISNKDTSVAELPFDEDGIGDKERFFDAVFDGESSCNEKSPMDAANALDDPYDEILKLFNEALELTPLTFLQANIIYDYYHIGYLAFPAIAYSPALAEPVVGIGYTDFSEVIDVDSEEVYTVGFLEIVENGMTGQLNGVVEDLVVLSIGGDGETTYPVTYSVYIKGGHYVYEGLYYQYSLSCEQMVQWTRSEDDPQNYNEEYSSLYNYDTSKFIYNFDIFLANGIIGATGFGNGIDYVSIIEAYKRVLTEQNSNAYFYEDYTSIYISSDIIYSYLFFGYEPTFFGYILSDLLNVEVPDTHYMMIAEDGISLNILPEIQKQMAEQRVQTGWLKFLTASLSVTTGVILIVASFGTATPVAVAIVGVAIGGAAAIYGIAELTESVQDLYCGYSGDITTQAYNFLRDGVIGRFVNSQEKSQQIYDVIGITSQILAAVFVPISSAINTATTAAKIGISTAKTFTRVLLVTSAKMIASAAVAFGVGYGVTELTQDPVLGLAAGVLSSILFSQALNKLDARFDWSGTKALNQKVKEYVENPFDENGKLKANIRYKSGEGDYLYETDQLGRITDVKADNLKLTTRDGRLTHDPNTPGKLPIDDAGHVIADRFGGSPKVDNLVSQNRTINRSDYKMIENKIAFALDNGGVVSYNVKVNYIGSNMRPASFDIIYVINGVSNAQTIINLR